MNEACGREAATFRLKQLLCNPTMGDNGHMNCTRTICVFRTANYMNKYPDIEIYKPEE